MPINAYTGLMGSGKSYEVVSSVIVKAVADGRRVVTNVDGIDGEAIRAYAAEKQDIPLHKLGDVVHCKNDDVARPDFLPYGEAVDTFCAPGDLVCIDEAWRFWGTDKKICREHAIFFREHRHYVHPDTKVACDLVLMVQDITDLNRTLKVVVELSFRTTKLKTVGLHKAYKIEMWEGYRQTVKGRVFVQQKRYDKEIFPLYSSYQGGKGHEQQVDERQNILRSPKLLAMLVSPFLLIGFAIWLLSRFFAHHGDKAHEASDPSHPVAAPVSSLASLSVPVGSAPHFSSSWGVAGVVRSGARTWVVLRGENGRVRLEDPSMFGFDGQQPIAGSVDGERVTRFSGPALAQNGGGSDAGKVLVSVVAQH